MLFSTFYIQRASHQHQHIWIQIRMQIATSTFNTLQEYLRFRMEAHDVGPMAKKQKVRSKHFSNQFFIMTENYIKHFSVNMRCYMRPVYVGYIVDYRDGSANTKHHHHQHSMPDANNTSKNIAECLRGDKKDIYANCRDRQ